MIIEAAIAGATTTMLGAFWLAHKIVEATLEDEERAEKREAEERERAETSRPEHAKGRRTAIAEKRRVLEERRARRIKDQEFWADRAAKKNFELKSDVDNLNSRTEQLRLVESQLLDLADEEAKIPLFDDESSK